MEDFRVEIAGEMLRLLPERAVFWAACSTLLIADTHWGKAATFRAAAIPVPGGTTQADLDRLSQAIERTCAARLVILGDLLHSREGRSAETFELVSRWRDRHFRLEIELIQGNHDLHAGLPLADWRMQIFRPPVSEGPFVWRHDPEADILREDAMATGPEPFALAGHIHPTVVLRGSARQSLRLPCFHLRNKVLVLPAFSSFAGGANIRPAEGDRVFPVSESSVFECDYC